jgi:hypothetical protein
MLALSFMNSNLKQRRAAMKRLSAVTILVTSILALLITPKVFAENVSRTFTLSVTIPVIVSMPANKLDPAERTGTKDKLAKNIQEQQGVRNNTAVLIRSAVTL